MPTIQYYKKDVYGVERLYIKDPEQAKLIRALSGMGTLSVGHKEALEKLGIMFEQVLPPS